MTDLSCEWAILLGMKTVYFALNAILHSAILATTKKAVYFAEVIMKDVLVSNAAGVDSVCYPMIW